MSRRIAYDHLHLFQAAFAHVYWVRDGRIVRFEQYTDTHQVVEAMRE